MTTHAVYPIGITGQAWGGLERAQWRARQVRQRSYADDVLGLARAIHSHHFALFDLEIYGEVEYVDQCFPLVALRSRQWQAQVPIVLVTGGVHGYETSGVHGALRFMELLGGHYAGRVNLLVVPCVSPWAYERIQRWNFDALDPNRNFFDCSPVPESAALMRLIEPLRGQIAAHIDLHETTDTDESEFGPAKSARDGHVFEAHGIPDGFYVVDDIANPQPDFQQAIITAVQQVTHIAPADAQGEIIGSVVVAPGVIRYPMKDLGLCAGISDARYTCTTEVYPDSPQSTPEQCVAAQVAAVRAAVDFVCESNR